MYAGTGSRRTNDPPERNLEPQTRPSLVLRPFSAGPFGKSPIAPLYPTVADIPATYTTFYGGLPDYDPTPKDVQTIDPLHGNCMTDTILRRSSDSPG